MSRFSFSEWVVILLVAFVALMPCDPGEQLGYSRFELWCASQRLLEYVDAHGGRFPANPSEDAQLSELLAGRDAWGRPYRYETLDAARSKARVFTLGGDGAPGGESCDADVVCWLAGSALHENSDARVDPFAENGRQPER